MAGTGKAVEQVSRDAERPAQVPAAQCLDSQGVGGDVLLEAGSSLQTPRRQSLQKSTSYFLTEGVLYRQGKNRNQKFLFTDEEKNKAFWEAHVVEDRHYGLRNTCANLSKKYYWPGVSVDAQKWIKKCKRCQDRSIRMAAQAALEAGWARDVQPKSRAALHFSAPQDKGLFSFVSLQLFGPLEETARGARFAFVSTDYFTKSVHAAPMRACAPEDTSRQICELVRKFGLPEGIFSAQQHGYILQLNKILKMALKIKRNLVVEYSPQTDGFLEDSKAFVRRLLSLVLAANPADWDQHLHEVFFLQSGPSDYEEEEDLSSLEVELQEASSAPDENRPPSFCGPEALKSCPDGERDTPGKARRHEDVCSLPDEGSRDVFAVLQCDRCQAWAHDLCVTRQHGWAYQKTSVRCRACLLADEGAGPGPGPFSRALEVEESRTSRTVGPTWPATGTTGSKHSSSSK